MFNKIFKNLVLRSNFAVVRNKIFNISFLHKKIMVNTYFVCDIHVLFCVPDEPISFQREGQKFRLSPKT